MILKYKLTKVYVENFNNNSFTKNLITFAYEKITFSTDIQNRKTNNSYNSKTKHLVLKQTETEENGKQVLYNQGQQVTHAYGHRLADVQLAGFAPAFTLSLCDSEYARKPPMPIASVVSSKFRKKKRNKDCIQF